MMLLRPPARSRCLRIDALSRRSPIRTGTPPWSGPTTGHGRSHGRRIRHPATPPSHRDPAALGGLTPTGPRTPSATRLRPGALGLPCSARSAAGWCVAQGMRPATSTHCRPTCAIPAHAWPQRGAARARSLASSAGGSSPPKMNGRATSTAGIAPAGVGGEPATYLPITASYLAREALAAAQVHGRREKRARAGH